MTKDQQDLAWKCLPKDKRTEFKELYLNSNVGDRIYNTYDCGYTNALKDIFGEHNFTSNTEPPELLIVERKKIQEVYKNLKEIVNNEIYSSKMYSMHIQIMRMLETLFGNKCLPDKEQPKPKFDIGQKVVYTCDNGRKEVGEIAAYFPDEEKFKYSVRFGKEYHNMTEHQLKLYTEENKETMEEKQLNFCEILKGHEGETFYSPLCGNVTLIGINNINNYPISIQYKHKTIVLNKFGQYYDDVDGEIMLFPSKDQRDWNKWDEENNHKTPKTWNELLQTDKEALYYVKIKRDRNLDNTIVDLSVAETPIEKSALALLKIHQLIEVGYGGNVKDGICIVTKDGNFLKYNTLYTFSPFAFHTKEQAEEFLSYDENVQLLKDYFMI